MERILNRRICVCGYLNNEINVKPKKLMNILTASTILICIVALNRIAICQDDRWEYITATDSQYYYLDKETILFDNLEVSVWIKIECFQNCIESENKILKHALEKWRLNCADLTYKRIQRIGYYEDGETYTNDFYSSKKKGHITWKIIIPESVEEIVWKHVCR